MRLKSPIYLTTSTFICIYMKTFIVVIFFFKLVWIVITILTIRFKSNDLGWFVRFFTKIKCHYFLPIIF